MSSTNRKEMEKAKEILAENPLCDNCLGRQFGLLGHGLDNKTRGNSIKNVLVMDSYKNYVNDKSSVSDLDILKSIAINGMSEFAQSTLKKIGIELEGLKKACYLCGGRRKCRIFNI